MSYIEDHVLAYKAPLYGRRTAQMKILPFDFAETCRCFNNFSDEDKAIIYGIVGGTPQYLLQMDDKLSIGENIRNTFLNTSSFLFEETENLLKQEVRDTANYMRLLRVSQQAHPECQKFQLRLVRIPACVPII